MRAQLSTGVSLAFDRVGDPSGSAVVLLHGLSSRRQTYIDVLAALSAHDVFNVDLRGHGESDRSQADRYRATDYSADIAAFVESVVGRPAGIVGHSLGGVVAAQLTIERPDLVTAAFLEDPPLLEGDHDRRAASPVAAFFPMLVAAVRDLRVKGAKAEDHHAIAATHVPPDSIAERAVELHTWDPETMQAAVDGDVWRGFDPLATLARPVTVLRADPAAGAVFTEADADSFTAANAHAVIECVAGATHSIHAPETLDPYLDHLTRFLAGL